MESKQQTRDSAILDLVNREIGQLVITNRDDARTVLRIVNQMMDRLETIKRLTLELSELETLQ